MVGRKGVEVAMGEEKSQEGMGINGENQGSREGGRVKEMRSEGGGNEGRREK